VKVYRVRDVILQAGRGKAWELLVKNEAIAPLPNIDIQNFYNPVCDSRRLLKNAYVNTNNDHVMVAVENRWTNFITFDIVMLLGPMIYKLYTINITLLKITPITGIDTSLDDWTALNLRLYLAFGYAS
jgi:hypothetical protein